MLRFIVVLFGLALLSGCATPIPKSETIPVFSGTPTPTIGVAVTDHRSFILSGNKKEWFEGIFRGAFGIPHSLARVGEFEKKPFAFYLATKLKEALNATGSKASIVPVPMGTSIERIAARIKGFPFGSTLAVVIHKSRYDLGPFNPEYAYHFELLVFDSGGKILAQKSFMKFEQQLELSDKYNVFDYMSELYKKRFDSFLNDPEVKNALSTAGGS